MRRALLAFAALTFLCQPAFALQANWDRCLSWELTWEGGYAQRPQEPGGCANRGISLTTLQSSEHNPDLTCTDLKNLSLAETKQIYYEKFGNVIGFDNLGAGYDCAALTAAIMFGPGRGTDDRPGFLAFDAEAKGDFGYLIVLMLRAKMYRDDCGPVLLPSGKLQWFCRGWSDRLKALYQLSSELAVQGVQHP